MGEVWEVDAQEDDGWLGDSQSQSLEDNNVNFIKISGLILSISITLMCE